MGILPLAPALHPTVLPCTLSVSPPCCPMPYGFPHPLTPTASPSPRLLLSIPLLLSPLDAPLQPPPPGRPRVQYGGGGGFARRVAVSLNRVVWGAWGNLGVCAMPPCPGLSPAVGHTLLGVCGPLAISLYLQDVTGPIVPLGSG